MKYTIPFLIAIIILLLFKQCEPYNDINLNENKTDSISRLYDAINDSLTSVVDSLKSKEAKLKELEKKTYSNYKKASKKYHEVRDIVKSTPCDSATKEVISACDSLESACENEIEVLKQENAIKDSINVNQTEIIKNDSVVKKVVVNENKSLKKQLRKQKILTITGYALSALVVMVSLLSIK